MSFLEVFFNPSFLLLAILVLAVSLLVTYFESKLRAQNHTIESMLSLVSTVVEDIEGVKIGLNYLANNNNNNNNINPANLDTLDFTLNTTENKLITVSDDEDSDDEEDEDNDEEASNDEEDEEASDEEEEEDVEEASDEDTDTSVARDEEISHTANDIKFLKIHIEQPKQIVMEETLSDELNLEETPSHDITQYTPRHETLINENETENENENENEPSQEPLEISYNDLKSINISLEETLDSTDYKKFPLQKLRTIVSEKGLSTDSSKLKKNELLKLLGID